MQCSSVDELATRISSRRLLDWLCVNARWQAEYIFYIFIVFYVRYGIVTFSTVFIKASGRQWTMPFWEEFSYF